jgi:hypothetical protein
MKCQLAVSVKPPFVEEHNASPSSVYSPNEFAPATPFGETTVPPLQPHHGITSAPATNPGTTATAAATTNNTNTTGKTVPVTSTQVPAEHIGGDFPPTYTVNPLGPKYTDDDKEPTTAQADFVDDPFRPFDNLPDERPRVFTFRALFIGLCAGALVNASNVFLGLRSGWTFTVGVPAF